MSGDIESMDISMGLGKARSCRECKPQGKSQEEMQWFQEKQDHVSRSSEVHGWQGTS
jgi:hypothetical protein